MIHPDMATMLGTISCDAAVPPQVWKGMVQRAVERSFNAITVDGDTSTNDTVLAFSAGESLPDSCHDELEQESPWWRSISPERSRGTGKGPPV